MKVWKLISGILSMVLFLVVAFQSCAAGVANTLAENGEVSGSAGILVAILMLAGGIVSVATRKSEKIILLEQVRTIDKQRLRQYLGMIPDDIVARVDKALAISVALEKMKATDV